MVGLALLVLFFIAHPRKYGTIGQEVALDKHCGEALVSAALARGWPMKFCLVDR